MSFETFPLPEAEGLIDSAGAAIESQANGLGQALDGVGQVITGSLAQQQSGLDTVRRAMVRKLNGELRAQQAKLNAPVMHLLPALHVRVGETGALLTPVLVQAAAASTPAAGVARLAPAPVYTTPIPASGPVVTNPCPGVTLVEGPPPGGGGVAAGYKYWYGPGGCVVVQQWKFPSGGYLNAEGAEDYTQGLTLGYGIWPTVDEAIARSPCAPLCPQTATPPPPPSAPTPTPTPTPPTPAPTPPPPPPEPTPTPPPAPDTRPKDACALGPAVLDLSRGTDWCGRLRQIADYLVTVGTEILRDRGAGKPYQAVRNNWWWRVASWLYYDPSKVKELTDRLDEWEDNTADCDLLDQWLSALDQLTKCEPSRLTALLAVKAALDMLSDAAVHWGVAIADKSHNFEAFGVPEMVGIGAGSHSSVDRTNDDGFSARLRAVLVPARELLDIILRLECPLEMPSPGEAAECFVRGEVDERTARCWSESHGVRWDQMLLTLTARSERLTAEQVIQWGRRFDVPEEEIARMLTARGWFRSTDRAGVQELFDELPTIADHLHWLQRNVFDDEYVADYDLMNGFEERFWVKFGHDLRARGMKKDYAALHYAAHWINPAPGQLAEMVQRLRPGRVDPDGVFTPTDFLRILAEQDVAPYFRGRLLEIAYRPIGLRFLRQVYYTGQIDEPELAERFQDLAFKASDAAFLAKTETVLKERTRTTLAKGYTPSKLSALFPLGTVSEETVRTEMDRQGFTPQESDSLMQAAVATEGARMARRGKTLAEGRTLAAVQSAYTAGTVSREQAFEILQTLNVSADNGNALLDAIDAQATLTLTKQGIAAVRAGFLRGELSLDQARGVLSSLGVVDPRLSQYLRVWQLAFHRRGKQASVAQILRWVRDGLLTPDVARARLYNLGYTDPDVLLMLAEVRQQMDTARVKAEQSALRNAQQAASQLRQIERELLAAQRSVQQELRRRHPTGEIKRQWIRGIIDTPEARNELGQEGYLPLDIDRLLRDWEIDREKWREKHSAEAPPVPVD